jgi:hypothetical protein
MNPFSKSAYHHESCAVYSIAATLQCSRLHPLKLITWLLPSLSAMRVWLLALCFVLCRAGPSCSKTERKLYPPVDGRNTYKPGNKACSDACGRHGGEDYNWCHETGSGWNECSQADDLDIWGCPITECINKEKGKVYGYFYGYHKNGEWDYCSKNSVYRCAYSDCIYDSKRLDKKFPRLHEVVTDAPAFHAWSNQMTLGVGLVVTGVLTSVSILAFRRRNQIKNTVPSEDMELQQQPFD